MSHEPILLTGSRALIAIGYTINRTPSDWDLITTFDGLQQVTRSLRRDSRVDSIPLSENKTVLRVHSGPYKGMVEVEIAWPESSGAELLDLTTDCWPTIGLADLRLRVPSLDQLYTMKLSHRYLKNSPHFRKTRDDIEWFREHGGKVFDDAWLKKREAETYTYNHPKLNVMKGDFFKGDGVEYVYDHDDIHRAMAHFRDVCAADAFVLPSEADLVPAYRLYMKDGAEVQCDRKKFETLPEHIRLWGVLEEAQVLALERSQIPFRGKVDPRRSFDIALMKVCTSITSGWFREYAWENFYKVESMYEEDYVDRFWAAVEAGKVRKFQSDEKTD